MRTRCGIAHSHISTHFTGTSLSSLSASCLLIIANNNSLWDSFRSQLPFLTIFDPKSVSRMIASLIDTQRHLGWLPDCRMSLCKGNTFPSYRPSVVT